ncbi:hypothetical protein ACLIJR_16780 [Hydrogenophaga sp. XSHU_21]
MATKKVADPVKKATAQRTKRVELALTKEQLTAIEAAFGPDIAKKMSSIAVAKTGASIYSHPVMN